MKDLGTIYRQFMDDNVRTINGKFMDALGKIYGGFRNNLWRI